MSYTAGVLLLVTAVAILILAALQVSQYRRGRELISRRQLILRLITAAVILTVITKIFVGVLIPWPETPEGALYELCYWTVLTLFACSVIFLAIADLRQLERERHLRQAEIYEAMQEAQDRSTRVAED